MNTKPIQTRLTDDEIKLVKKASCKTRRSLSSFIALAGLEKAKNEIGESSE